MTRVPGPNQIPEHIYTFSNTVQDDTQDFSAPKVALSHQPQALSHVNQPTLTLQESEEYHPNEMDWAVATPVNVSTCRLADSLKVRTKTLYISL